MKLCNIGHGFDYELEKLVRIFLPFEKINVVHSIEDDARMAVCRYVPPSVWVKLKLDGQEIEKNTTLEICDDETAERTLAVLLYECFAELLGYRPEWGILTGVRPAKLFSRLCRDMGTEAAQDYFKNGLLVGDRKISLCREAVEGEDKITSLSRPDSFSLYLSVPFCPTRCTYCSFVSHSVDRAKKMIPRYTELLCEELRATAKIAADLGLRLETVYMGGGTPTTLSAEQLSEVLGTVNECFDTSNLREFTVEAGRPDTFTRERLLAIKNSGVTRISINPQTMNDNVLEAIGRKHTALDAERAFGLAREIGFDNINMDLIAGLPEDTVESFRSTLDRVLDLNPESVTVHSLAMKRAATLVTNGSLPEAETGKTASLMVEYARDTLTKNGILPYYMYRQSKTVGNLENVGYAKRGFEGLYNVYIMDETHTILACGASAVTKLREPHGPMIERIFNFKYPYEYIDRFDEQIKRKDGIYKFYEKHSI